MLNILLPNNYLITTRTPVKQKINELYKNIVRPAQSRDTLLIGYNF